MISLMWYATASAALAFVLGSATTNAMFMASLGRTQVEIAILVIVSVGADLAKVALPVAIWRATVGRAWFVACLSSLLLAGVIGLSVTSGTGFVALTRGAVVSQRDAAGTKLAALEADRLAIMRRLQILPAVREPGVLAAEYDAMTSDRRWQATKKCTEPNGPASRQFCTDMHRLRVEQVSAQARDRLSGEERVLRERIEEMRSTGAANAGDPQIEALAAVFGIRPDQLRAGLGLMIALVLELGAVVLVLLLSGKLLREFVATTEAAVAVPVPVKAAEPEMVQLVPQVDRSFWQRRRSRQQNAVAGGSADHGA